MKVSSTDNLSPTRPMQSNCEVRILQLLLQWVYCPQYVQDSDLKKLKPSWRRLSQMAQYHQVLPRLYSMYERLNCLTLLPKEVCRHWEIQTGKVTDGYSKRIDRFQAALSILEECQVPYVPVKGMPGEGIYKDPLRPIGDADVFVKKANWVGLRQQLGRLGFFPDFEVNRFESQDSLIKHGTVCKHDDSPGRLALVRGELQLDVHWSPLYTIEGEWVRVHEKDFWSYASPMKSGFRFHLPLEQQAVFCLVHASDEGLLKHWIDVAAYLKRLPNFEHILSESRLLNHRWDSRSLVLRSYSELMKTLALNANPGRRFYHTVFQQQSFHLPSRHSAWSGMQSHYARLCSLSIGDKFRYFQTFFVPSEERYEGCSRLKAYFLHYRRSMLKVFEILVESTRLLVGSVNLVKSRAESDA